jgi:hypothetical protein
MPSRSTALAIAALSVLALALTTWYSFAGNGTVQRSGTGTTPAVSVTACSGLVAPDAIDRCEQQINSQGDPVGHGH